MFCPKCGSQQSDKAKFCRGCGAEISGVLAVVDRSREEIQHGSLEEKAIYLQSRAVSGVMLGIGFAIITAILFTRSSDGILWLLPLAFTFFFSSIGTSRMLQAVRLRKLLSGAAAAAQPSLPTGGGDLSPPRSPYRTGDLLAEPMSVTERTTRNLRSEDK